VAAPPYVDEIGAHVDGIERAYVCGSAGFASFAERLLGEAGVRRDIIRVEQFGASG
jgi:ferredoxin-NADP reductase